MKVTLMFFVLNTIFITQTLETTQKHMPIQVSKQQPVVNSAPQDSDGSSDILQAFFSKVVPGMINLCASSQTGDTVQAQAGINQFTQGVVQFFQAMGKAMERCNPDQLAALFSDIVQEESVRKFVRTVAALDNQKENTQFAS